MNGHFRIEEYFLLQKYMKINQANYNHPYELITIKKKNYKSSISYSITPIYI